MKQQDNSFSERKRFANNGVIYSVTATIYPDSIRGVMSNEDPMSRFSLKISLDKTPHPEKIPVQDRKLACEFIYIPYSDALSPKVPEDRSEINYSFGDDEKEFGYLADNEDGSRVSRLLTHEPSFLESLNRRGLEWWLGIMGTNTRVILEDLASSLNLEIRRGS